MGPIEGEAEIAHAIAGKLRLVPGVSTLDNENYREAETLAYVYMQVLELSKDLGIHVLQLLALDASDVEEIDDVEGTIRSKLEQMFVFLQYPRSFRNFQVLGPDELS